MSGPRRAAGGSRRLARELGLAGLVATALCAMVGVGINIIPFMIQRSEPGIGAAVPVAYVVAAVPAALAATAGLQLPITAEPRRLAYTEPSRPGLLTPLVVALDREFACKQLAHGVLYLGWLGEAADTDV